MTNFNDEWKFTQFIDQTKYKTNSYIDYINYIETKYEIKDNYIGSVWKQS